MRVITMLVAAVALFAVQSTARTVYIHVTEFLPAKREWDAAKAKGDRQAMHAAFEKELAAARRQIDPFWFLRGS